MKKRVLALLLAVGMVIGLTACGGGGLIQRVERFFPCRLVLTLKLLILHLTVR